MIFVREGIEDLRFSFRDCVQRSDLVVEIDTGLVRRVVFLLACGRLLHAFDQAFGPQIRPISIHELEAGGAAV